MSLAVLGVPAGERIELGRLSRPSLLVPLETSAVEVTLGAKRVAVDRTSFLVAPKRSAVVLRARTPANRVALLGVDDTLVQNAERRYAKLGLDGARLEVWLAEPALLPRTVWVHEIAHRYVFERHALGERDNLATRFLEIEIVKEVYFLFRDRDDDGADRESAGQKYSGPVERALAWIEGHVFDWGDVKDLARRCGASESSLLRSFRRELGCTPGAYWRNRRLDESMVLLRTGRYSIAEVARRVGYEKATSFGFAFRSHFGDAPSAFVRRRPNKRAP